MVVDDQDSNANHETPFPTLFPEQGIAPSSEDDTGAGTTPRPLSLTHRTEDGPPQPHGRRRATTATPASDAVPDGLAP